MDRNEKFEKRRADEQRYAPHSEYGRDNDYADSWFKQRLNHVRNEARKELRTKIIRVGRDK